MSFLASCREYFGTDNLYDVLGVSKDADDAAVKRAYRRISLKVHPDRVKPDERDIATKKFQIVSKIHCILSDSEARKVYDETGEIYDEGETTRDRDWEEYWRLLYPKISLDDILKFEKEYKDSEEELDDLKSAYMEFEGDMDQIMENVLCASHEDEERFEKLLRKMIKTGEIPDYHKFSKESKRKKAARKRKAKEEASEAEEHKKELGLDGDASLRSLIQARQASRASQADSFFDQLAEKYAKPQKKKKK